MITFLLDRLTLRTLRGGPSSRPSPLCTLPLPKHLTRLPTLAAAFLWFCLCGSSGAVVYVDQNAPGPEHDGTSWDTAFAAIQEGVEVATPGGDVWVADGVYVENVVMGSGVAIYGGFLGAEPGGYEDSLDQRDYVNNVTTIDGNQSGSCVVLAVDGRVDGFAITNGRGAVLGDYTHGGGVYCEDLGGGCAIANNCITANSPDYGGGVYCWGSSPTITNNTMSDNSAGRIGGGVYCHHSSPTVTDNIVTGNSAGRAGGGICCVDESFPIVTGNAITASSAYLGGGVCSLYGASPTVTYNTIRDNVAVDGGGISCHDSLAIFSYNTIIGNSATDWGGGISCWDSSPTVVGNAISGNSSDTWGGGIYCWNSSPLVANNIFIDNSALWGGGILFWHNCSPAVTNNTVSGSSASESGGGVCCWLYSSAVVANNIVTDNTAGSHGGGLHCDGSSWPFLSHNDLWANAPDNYSGCEPGEGDISADPLFVDRENGDFHLLPESPCIDAGSNDYVFTDEDIDGDPRIVDACRYPIPHLLHPGYVDIGADEFVPAKLGWPRTRWRRK